jgi:SAM-dependent methyltransferase
MSTQVTPLENVDDWTVDGYGGQWSTFDHGAFDEVELQTYFDLYFKIFPWHELPKDAVGFDAGCGTGRWARLAAPRVGRLHCVDASARALAVAQQNLASLGNCDFHNASLADMPMPDGSMDFGYSLGVLHHIPDTEAGLAAIVRKLKPGAPLLVYIYYALENRSALFRAAFHASEVMRRRTSVLPYPVRLAISQVMAGTVYWPMARLARVLEDLGANVDGLPLSAYRRRSFYALRTDAMDRFGTKLVHRYSRDEIREMMQRCGLERTEFQEGSPYWVAVGRRRG